MYNFDLGKFKIITGYIVNRYICTCKGLLNPLLFSFRPSPFIKESAYPGFSMKKTLYMYCILYDVSTAMVYKKKKFQN